MAKETHCWGLRASNRHAIWDADTEIANLEKALAADGTHSIFAQTYSRRRLHEIHATPGLGTPQRIKLEKLFRYPGETRETVKKAAGLDEGAFGIEGGRSAAACGGVRFEAEWPNGHGKLQLAS
jgi:hypothetical protein